MKKIFIIFWILLLFSGCSTKTVNKKEIHIGDRIFADIEKDYGRNLKQDTLTDGTLVYTFYLKGLESMAKEKSLIGYIDKTLEKVPEEIKEGEYYRNHRYNTYKWNTPMIALDIQSTFHSVDSIYVRIFMNKK